MVENQDTEFTLSTGKLLAFFFGMVVICGIFFSLGYGVGRNSSSAASTTVLDSSSLSTVQNSGAAKPSASKPITLSEMQQTEQKPCAEGDANCSPSTEASSGGQVTEATKSSIFSTKAEAKSADASNKTNATLAKTPELSGGQTNSGYMVQVAAVSKQEDADALVNALRKKQYPVFVVNLASSNLFHVQVGPFAQQKDAEAMRSKLVSDGYNAILKR